MEEVGEGRGEGSKGEKRRKRRGGDGEEYERQSVEQFYKGLMLFCTLVHTIKATYLQNE